MAKKVLVISPTPSHPQNAGNRSRVYSLLSSIREMGHDLSFLHIGMERGGNEQVMRSCWGNGFYSAPYTGGTSSGLLWKVRRLLDKELAWAYTIDHWYDASLNGFLRQLQSRVQFDIVVVEYVFFSKALECFGRNVLKVIDTLDVFTDRHRRFLGQGLTPSWFSTTARQEAKGLSRADIIVAIQERDAGSLCRLTNRRVVTVGHIVPTRKPSPSTADGRKIAFVGSSHPMNVHGINHFIDQVLPQVKASCPTVQLILTGRVCDAVEDFAGCVKLREIEDMSIAYEMADLVINPVLFGTGLKIKTIEALGFAKPLVTSSPGAEGLEHLAGQAFLVADSAEEFAASIIDTLSNTEVANKLARNAYDFACRSNERNLGVLAQLLL